MFPFPLRIPQLFCHCRAALPPDTCPELGRLPAGFPYGLALQRQGDPVCCFRLFLHPYHPLCSVTPRRSALLASPAKASPTLQASLRPLSTELSAACHLSAPHFVLQRGLAYSAEQSSKPCRPGFYYPAVW